MLNASLGGNFGCFVLKMQRLQRMSYFDGFLSLFIFGVISKHAIASFQLESE